MMSCCLLPLQSELLLLTEQHGKASPIKDGNKPQSTQNRGFVKNLRTTKDLFFISIELPRNIGRTLLCPWVMKLLIHDESGSMGVSQNEIIPFFIYPSDNSVNETE